MQSAKSVIFAAGGQQPLSAAGFPVEFVAGKVGDRQLIEGNAEQMPAAVVKLFQLTAVGQRDRGAVAEGIILPCQLTILTRSRVTRPSASYSKASSCSASLLHTLAESAGCSPIRLSSPDDV
jgi:hypothetical protein